MPRICSLLAFSLVAFSCVFIAPAPIPAANPAADVVDKPIATKDAAGRMRVPPGFKVTLFAGEPDVVQPIAFTFDDRGRMWVVECVMYPKWSQDGKGGRDRVVILEDTDGDGVHDKKTVVLDNGVNLSGIEIGFGGMYLCSSPNLIFIPIQDDKPSGKPEILLDGWNIKEAKHNVFNSLTWGPDGWLYGCNGIQTKSHVGKPGTPDKDRVWFDCGVWKFHPTRKVFEVVATGTTNPWGLDFDEHGEMFITNCVIDHLWHVVPGGRYTRMYGEDYNSHTYGYMGSAVDYKHWAGGPWTESRFDKATGAAKKEHGDAGGGHAHSGAAIYLGENFPKEYRNTLFTCNIHGNRLNNDGLERTPTGMKGVRRPDFLFANDPWFRGICVKQGPDGGLYVSDWSDTGECHNYEVVDASNGRIYRTIYGDQKGWKGNIATMTDDDLVKAIISKNEWLSRKARQQLQERAHRDPKVATKLADDVRKLWKADVSPPELLRLVWALASMDQLKPNDLDTLYLSKNESLRAWAFRFGLTLFKADIPQMNAMIDLTRGEQSPFVRLHLYGALQRAKFPYRGDLVENSSIPVEETDPNLSLMRWYVIEPLAGQERAYLSLLLENAGASSVRQNVVRRYLAGFPDKSDKVVEAASFCAAKNGDPRKLLDVLLGMQAAYADQRDVKLPNGWNKLSFTKHSSEIQRIAEELSVKFGDVKTIDLLRKRITDVTENPADRNRAIELLSARKMPEIVESLRAGLRDPQVRGAAIRGLANYPEDSTALAILEVYPKLTADEKIDAIQTLASRKSFAAALLSAIEKGTLPKTEITAYSARQIIALKDKSLDAKLAKVWGTIRPASATRVVQTEKLKSLLTASTLQNADKAHGRQLFVKNCAACHKLFGEGGEVGPELTGSQRASLDYVLENVLDPSAVVANEYKLITFNLIDGRVVSGIVRKTTGQALTIRTLNDELTVLVKDIESQKPTGLSIMPDGLFDNLKDDEIRDLVAYLGSPQQVPLK